ncbi:family 43 glycosylhydrolase [uncultured Hymenobacter sp.]|uniref:glycoside hydrolase family 43 protein n=1 Tax=uncultured Hymenobacter sp. TaxID=170016 RepID=UPI0035C97740
MTSLLFRRLAGPLLALNLLACSNGSSDPKPTPPPTPPVVSTTFVNPLLASGPDPWVYEKDGFYYYTNTTGGNVTLRKTAKMSALGSAPSTVVWRAPATGNYSQDVWAPELHFLDGKWYIYFTAGPGNVGQQRSWVLENANADPTTRTWTEKGRIFSLSEDFWAIDMSVFEQNDSRYALWSGHENNGTNEQRLYISKMENPWTLTGPRVELSRPQYGWERSGPVAVNEGPEIIKHGAKTNLVYSASHCETDDYALGLLTCATTADPMLPESWTKSATPIFVTTPASRAFGPGHNGFFQSKDGTQDWLIYHANLRAGQRCGDARNPRMQPFTWNADDTPNFGAPVATGLALPKPSGE